MKHYVIKSIVGPVVIDTFCLSELSALEIKQDIDRKGGLDGPGGWVAAAVVMAVLDCAACGIKPPVLESNVVPFKLVGGKDDARGSGESEASSVSEEPGA